ncbi:cardiolipin synthase [Cribrihabitans marinus]|uniref:Cardiolipin synthase n=1 Tax=Cribrihabitans marinus TaxID=1227549 RepID=A0A1H6WK79_9RHOB|nr:cardiolipin synthase [Cribrihabitans marinus]GGH24090.1 cardiolipin synthase A [Cribrihabitans marinus]SEJ15614.1 cardiolipin synthase [Cribrihabitans marinus]
MWTFLVSSSVVVLYGVAVFFGIRAAQTARTPQGAVGWVVFLLAAPFFAVPAYLVLGHHRFKGYRIARTESQRVVAGIRALSKQVAPTAGSIRPDPRPFEDLAGMPVVRGNSAKLLVDGTETFDAILAAIDSAQSYILVQFYIVRDDRLGRTLRDRLIQAAARGVHVRFMTDAIGSYQLSGAFYEHMSDHGIDVADPHQQRGPNWRFQINYRNHRKTVIIDGLVGFIGGHNVGCEYLGEDPDFGHWRDTHVQLEGPVTNQLQLIFAEDWHWARDEDILDDLYWQVEPFEGGMDALIVATGPSDRTESGSMMFFSAIAAAQERIWVASPYFVPDLDILSALKHAAMRGIDVRLLVPDMIDHRAPWLAAFAYFDEVCEAGVKVFRYTGGFMHQKVFLVDDTLAAVGTSNLDNRSFRLNFEAMALVFDPRAAEAVADMLTQDFALSYELLKTLDLQPPHIRYGAPLARLLAPVL